MGAMDTSTINQEFTVIGDFITYYQWLFDVSNALLFNLQCSFPAEHLFATITARIYVHSLFSNIFQSIFNLG